jgi:hypothetical protein
VHARLALIVRLSNHKLPFPAGVFVAVLFALVALAGCLSEETPTFANESLNVGGGLEMYHDHNDVSLHTASSGVNFVNWSPLGIELGENGFANFVIWEGGAETLALVAVDGDDEGGFVIADISDPREIEVLGTYWAPGNGIQEVRITPDGRFAVMNVQNIPSGAAQAGLSACEVCLHVVNIEDRANPRTSSIMPVELLGSHNMHFEEQDGSLYLYAVAQPLGGTPVEPGNHFWVYQFQAVGSEAALLPVGQYNKNTIDDEGRSFPHDVMVQQHPLTKQRIAYVSHWDGGHVSVDVTNPNFPVELDVLADPAPSDALAVHWMWQEEWVRNDGRVIAWSAPEIGGLSTGTGVIRALDVTDPANMQQIGTWTLPGNTTIEGRYQFSPHTVFVDPDTMLAAVSHYHAGVWILDVADPENPVEVGFYLPHGNPEEPYDGPTWWKKPNFSPDGYGPNVYQVRWHDGTLWVSDRGTGLYALEMQL